MKEQPLWSCDAGPEYPSIKEDLQTEVLIIGGGIAGVTAASLLKEAGIKVVLVERGRLGCGETGHTTAHITYPTDTRLKDLVARFGSDHAQAAWDAQSAGADQIAENVYGAEIKCDLRHVPGYLFAAYESDLTEEAPRLVEDFHLGAGLGFDASYLQSAPVVHRPAVRFANLLKFHPLKYLHALAKGVPGQGGHVFENSEVTEFHDTPRHVICNGCAIQYDFIFIATHVPLQGLTGGLSATLFQTKLAACSTYAVGAKAPANSLPEALWWDTNHPYFYLRVDRRADCDYVIAGGEDHKTGQEADPGQCYARLEEKLRCVVPEAQVDRRWSGQVIETNDGLPFIGETQPHQFIATGFAGTGMTWGTVAAMMFRDHVTGITNPWRDLLGVHRKPLAQAWDYLRENKDYPYYLLKGLLSGADADDPVGKLFAGEGKILRHKGKKVAAYRNEEGSLVLLSPVCTHLGCTVAWNPVAKSWDCPCHGSRFTAEGELMAGPAETALETQAFER